MKKKSIIAGVILLLLFLLVVYRGVQYSEKRGQALQTMIEHAEAHREKIFPNQGYKEHLRLFGSRSKKGITSKVEDVYLVPKYSPFSKDPDKIKLYDKEISDNQNVYEEVSALSESYHVPYHLLFDDREKYHNELFVSPMAQLFYSRNRNFLAAVHFFKGDTRRAIQENLELMKLLALFMGEDIILDVCSQNLVAESMDAFRNMMSFSVDSAHYDFLLQGLNQNSIYFSRERILCSEVTVPLVREVSLRKKEWKGILGPTENDSYIYSQLISALAVYYHEHPEKFKDPKIKLWLEDLYKKYHSDFFKPLEETLPFNIYMTKSSNIELVQDTIEKMVKIEPLFHEKKGPYTVQDQENMLPETRVILHVIPAGINYGNIYERVMVSMQRRYDRLRLAIASRIYYEENGELPDTPNELVKMKMENNLLVSNENYFYKDYYDNPASLKDTDALLLKNLFLNRPYLLYPHEQCYRLLYNKKKKSTTVLYDFKDGEIAQKVADTMAFYKAHFKRVDDGSDIMKQEYEFIRPKKALCICANGMDGDCDDGMRIENDSAGKGSFASIPDGDEVEVILMK